MIPRAARTPGLGLTLTLALALGGCEVRFGEPRLLWLLWLVPLVALFLGHAIARRRRLAERLVAAALLERLAPGASTRRSWSKAGLLLVAVTALLLALPAPRYGFTWEDNKRRGFDLVVALDVSDSMLATDGASDGLTRLERARRTIHDLVAMLEGDRVALVAFAGAAFVLCPLTLDHGAFGAFLAEVDPDAVSAKGTDLGAALHASLRAFDGGGADSRAVILITDGEDTVGNARAAAAAAAQEGVRVFAVGIGRDEGAPIPGPDGSFRRDRRGELVLSRLDEAALRDVATKTGGAYVRSATGDVDLEALYRGGIQAMLAEREIEDKRRQRWHERFQWLVGLAFAALALEALVPERGRRRHA